MARDFAKRKQGSGRKKAPARRQQPAAAPVHGWRWYGAGLLTGVFLSFLLYLGTLPPPHGAVPPPQQAPQATAQPPKPRFDFYTMLPEQSLDVEVEPAAEVAKPATNPPSGDLYLLQAGSFRQREDADRRRAELLLLGLDPKVEETSGDNGRWYRVYLGPFETHAKMARARSLTAAQNIDTLLLKRRKS